MSHIPIHNAVEFIRTKALPFLENRYDAIVYLNPNDYNNYPQQAFRHLLAFGTEEKLACIESTHVFNSWNTFKERYPKEWIFIFSSYDAKNSVEDLSSEKEAGITFHAATFFVPEHVWEITDAGITLLKGAGMPVITELQQAPSIALTDTPAVTIQNKIDKPTYIRVVETIQQYINAGNAYEVNYCIPFTGTGKIQPAAIYQRLNKQLPMPFSVYYKWENEYILSASPERFIKKSGQTIISQPIKGTSKRGNTPEEDKHLINQLRTSEKEQSENTMIVDLVRNDLSRTALPGSVHVPELSGLYTFPNVHQLISTVQASMDPAYTVIDVIKYAFPMGSMTGAPKVSVLRFIDQVEAVSRGPFSGTVGYMDPDDNFDFNVLIRSVFYNHSTEEVFMEAGSAITSYANAATEYEECLLKIAPLIRILTTS